VSVISVASARSYAQQAGFSGQGLNIIVAIAQAESSLDTQATHTNSDGSIDRGILQINDKYHPEVSSTCAFDPACSFQAGYRISSSGTNFNAWSTYTSGAYLKYMSGSTQTANVIPWYKFPVTHGYITKYQGAGTDTPHYAEDFGAPQDTPFFFLESGTIQKADYQAWGGEIFLKPDSGGPEEYVYHLDEVDVQQGQHVAAGQQVGLSGGQTSGGKHPTSPQYSTGPHIHFGEFTEYVNSPNGEIPYGPNPGALVAQAQDKGINLLGGIGSFNAQGNGGASGGGTTVNAPAPLGPQVNAILSEFPGFAGIALALDKAEQFPGVIWYAPGDSVQSTPPAWTYLVPGLSGIYQGASTVFNPQDYIGPAMRSVLDTMISNTIPLLVRGFIVFIGLALIAGLVRNAISATGIPETVGQIAKVGAMAA